MQSKAILVLDLIENSKNLNLQPLIRDGYRIDTVSGIGDASRAAKEPFDLVIVRTGEPELLALQLAHFPPQSSVLIICPENILAKSVECAGAGIRSFLVEPFTAVKLRETARQAVNKAQMIQDEVRHQVLSTLEQANRLLSSDLEIGHFFNVIVEMCHSCTKSDFVSLILKDELTGNYEETASYGPKQPVWEMLAREAMVDGKALMVDEANEDHPPIFTRMQSAGISALMSIPIDIKGENVGAINHLKLTSNGTYTKSDMNLGYILAWWAGITLENIRLFKEVEKQHTHVEDLLQEILNAQTNERKRVAIDIHDSVAQWMVGASFGIKACSTLISESRLGELEFELNKIRDTLQKSVRELRRTIFNLRPIPLQEIGLVPAIKQTTEALCQEDVHCEVETAGVLPPLSIAEETTIYWIVQESLSNIRKHANATSVKIRLSGDNREVKIEITDNGVGFDPDGVLSNVLPLEHMGLVGMQERAKLIGGSIQITSLPGAGTNVVLLLPVNNKQGIAAIT